MTANETNRGPSGPPPSSFPSTPALSPQPAPAPAPTYVQPEVKAAAPVQHGDAVGAVPTSGNGIAAAVLGFIALMHVIPMMAFSLGRLFIPTVVFSALALLFAARSIRDVTQGKARGRYGQAGITWVVITVVIWFFKINLVPFIAMFLAYGTTPAPVWPASEVSEPIAVFPVPFLPGAAEATTNDAEATTND